MNKKFIYFSGNYQSSLAIIPFIKIKNLRTYLALIASKYSKIKVPILPDL